MLRRILPHICIILSIMMLTFYVIDQVNNAMGFLDNQAFKGLFLFYCLAVIATSVILIIDNRRR